MKVKTLTYNHPITLKTRWTYDSWNRVRAIVYPDGEKVSYHYNKGGLLKSMEGDKNGYTTQYIRDIQYDHYDQRVFMEYGNGVTYNYKYNDETRRLDNLFSESTQQGITLQKNEYKYDNVGNILQIKGYEMDPFEHNYNYDASYRLENANGNGTWQGNNLTYEQSFAYTPSGRIDNKKTTSQKLSNQYGLYNEDYDNTYTYDVNDNPYAVRHITDNTNGLDYDFNWDKKGNMIYAGNTKRTLCWTEDNRLQAVKDNQMGAYYNYDASGERNLKLTGAVVQMSQNGVPYDYVMLESPTLYASGLITINERGYTKHYFEENKRVCSNIGGGFRYAGYDIMDSIELITPFLEQWRNAKDGIFKTFEQCIKSPVDLENTQEKIVKVMKDHEKDRNEEEYQFYYTNDHLGSSTYITNKEGQITQTLAYLPYGEDWVDLDNQPPYITPYKFNGKEKDQETGYQYFGARYQSPKLSIWLSVDPNSDNYPHATSYAYCNNNPVMLIDPDGKDWYEAENGNVKWDDRVVNQKNTPKGGTYIGNKDSDILNFYDMNQKGETLTTKQAGQHHDGDKRVFSTYTASNSVSVSVDIGQGEASEYNKDGKVFNGVTYTANGRRSNTSEVETYGGIGQTGGSFIVSYGGKEYKSFFFPEEGQNLNGGEGAFQAKKQIPASDISRSKSLQGFKATGGYNVNTPIGNIPVKTIWGQGLHFEQKWNYKR